MEFRADDFGERRADLDHDPREPAAPYAAVTATA